MFEGLFLGFLEGYALSQLGAVLLEFKLAFNTLLVLGGVIHLACFLVFYDNESFLWHSSSTITHPLAKINPKGLVAKNSYSILEGN